jgi:hypothetical protein
MGFQWGRKTTNMFCILILVTKVDLCFWCGTVFANWLSSNFVKYNVSLNWNASTVLTFTIYTNLCWTEKSSTLVFTFSGLNSTFGTSAGTVGGKYPLLSIDGADCNWPMRACVVIWQSAKSAQLGIFMKHIVIGCAGTMTSEKSWQPPWTSWSM